jgi:hypothetical protein
MIGVEKPERRSEQTTGLDCSSPECCLTLTPPPGSVAEPRNFTREDLSRNPSSRTLPGQCHRTNLNKATMEFYARTNARGPSLFIQTC